MKLVLSLVTLSLALTAQAQDTCPSKTLVTVPAWYKTCENVNSSPALVQVKLFAQGGAYGAYSALFAKGLVKDPAGNSLVLNQYTLLPEASLRLNVSEETVETAQGEYKQLSPSTKTFKFYIDNEANVEIAYNSVLKNATITKTYLPSYTMVAPAFFAPYVIPYAKISSFVAEVMLCEKVEGLVDAVKTCENVSDDGRTTCECSIEIVLQ